MLFRSPSLFGGQPFWADPNAMGLYPFYLLVLLLPMGWGMGIFYAFHLFAALVGAHLWVRSLGLSESSARIGALTFGLCGFFWWEIIHPPILAAFAWLPWWAFALENFSKSPRKGWAFICGLCFALIFLCGSFQMTLVELYMGVFYFLFRLAAGPFARQRMGGGTLAVLALVFIWASLPLWAFWVPVCEFFSHSVRVLQAFDFEGFNADLCLAPGDLAQFLFPANVFDAGGNPLPYPALLGNAGTLGIWVFLLGALAFLGKNKRAAFWALGAGGVWVLVAMGREVPLFKWLCEYVAGFSMTRSPFRFVFFFSAAGSLLAALGWEYLQAAKAPELRKIKWFVFLYGSILGAICLLNIHGRGGAITGLLAGGAGLGLWFLAPAFRRAGYWVFVSGFALSAVLNGWMTALSQRGPDSNFDFLKNRPELAEVKQMGGWGRVFIGDGIVYPLRGGGKALSIPLPVDAAYATGLKDVKGYNPLSLWGPSEILDLPLQASSRLLALEVILNGRRKALTPPGFTESKVGPIYLYSAKRPFPYVYGPLKFQVVSSDEARLALMGLKDFNPYELSYFSAPPAGGFVGEAPAGGFLNYQLTRDDPDDQTFQVSRQKGGWTVFSEVVYPGWKAFVDGKPAELLTANHVFRAVFVPMGSHEVRFSYEPVWWGPIRIGLLLWFLSVLGLFWKPWREWTLGVKKS